MKKYDYEVQAIAVQTVSAGHENSDLGKALREAEVTLRALALIGEDTILRAQKLEAVAKELVMEVIVDGRELNFAEVLQYANDFNKALNPVNIIQDEQLQN